MAFTLVGYFEIIDTGGALTQIDALSDQHITFDNKDILVPEWASNIIQVAPIGSHISGARVSAPSLRQRTELDITMRGLGSSSTVLTGIFERTDRPISLEAGEGLRFAVSETASAASHCTGLVWLEGERTAIPDGEIETIRATSATTTIPRQWTLCKLDLSQQLRAGRYAIVGLRVESSNGNAARLVIPGSAYRPGVLTVRSASAVLVDATTDRKLGSWGEFEHTFVPQLEILTASVDTSQVVYLDVVKIS